MKTATGEVFECTSHSLKWYFFRRSLYPEIKAFFFDILCADLVGAWLDLAKFGFGLERAPPPRPRSTC
jgi:hypothetical protein